MPDDAPPAPDSLEARLAALRAKVEAGFGARAKELAEVASRLGADPGARDELRRLAHKLRGTAGSHGHPALSERAAEVEDLARAESTDTPSLAAAAISLAGAVARAAKESGAVDASAPPKVPPRAEPLPSLAGYRFLAIDDELSTRKLLEVTLVSLAKAEARVVAEPAALLAALDEGAPYDLVLLDAMMPEISGRELALEVRSRAPEVAIAFFSAATAEELGWYDASHIASLWLRKPFKPRGLCEALAAFLSAR